VIEKKLTFFHRVTCDYSEAFLRRAQFTLAQAGVQLEVVSGQPWEGEGLVDVVDKLPFGRRVRNKRICGPMYYGEGSAIFTSTADMVVLEQSNAALDNYPLLTRRWIEKHFLEDNRVKVAFWGHGANLNAGGSQVIRRWWKRTFTTKVDWWFAYTELSARIVTDAGFPRNRITVLQNTIDTTELQRAKALVSEPMLQELRLQLFKEQEKHPTGVFCGRLVELKWIPFLLEGAERIHEYLPEFRMVMVGDGPYSAQVAGIAKTRPWFA
jgi:glycosyltransferase involved in cell wall biosynthesis